MYMFLNAVPRVRGARISLAYYSLLTSVEAIACSAVGGFFKKS